ncbi:MAG: DUF6273 domain-containing protein [Bacillota bacterium]
MIRMKTRLLAAILMAVTGLVLAFGVPGARAEYADGDVIFAEDLPVGAILTGFTVSGNGATNVAREAVVVRSGQSPRLVLTSNHGSDTVFGGNNNYNTSTLKSKIDSLSFSIAAWITNVSAPSVIDVTDGFSFGDGYSDAEGSVFLQELRTGMYWTRSPHPHYDYGAFYVHSHGYVYYDYVCDSYGVRPAFNLKSDTVLRYESGKFRITTDPADYQAAHYRRYGDLYGATDAARTAAVNAQNAANNAAARTWDATESKSAATLAKEARDKANQALAEINNVKTTVNNIQASVGPMIQKVATANAATCTQGTSIPVIVQASGATEFRARADTGSWTAWTPVGSSVTVTGITGTGAHVIYVEARNSAGTTATGHLTVFKL